MELLESVGPRPRQARYQAALRPDMKYVKIIKDFPTELLLHLTNFARDVPKTCQNFGPLRGRTSPGSSARLHRLCRIPRSG
jgi:hypothetical protein